MRPRENRIWKMLFFSMLSLSLTISCTFMSLALFADKDMVTNTQHSSMADITLLEPQWVASGIKQAKKLEPGMCIQKDPQVRNDGKTGVYIRLRIDITDQNGNQLEQDSARYQAIIASLYCYVTTQDDTGAEETKAVSLLAQEADGSLSVPLRCQNPDFTYQDGYFYYEDNTDDTTENKYIVLNSGEITPTLFDYLQIPVLKSQYNQVFDTDFTIDVVAQAVAATYEGDEITEAFASLEESSSEERTGTESQSESSKDSEVE